MLKSSILDRTNQRIRKVTSWKFTITSRVTVANTIALGQEVSVNGQMTSDMDIDLLQDNSLILSHYGQLASGGEECCSHQLY